MANIDIKYTPPPTVRKMMKSDREKRLIAGPVGSGKSIGCIMEIVRRCMQMPKDVDGFRHSRWCVIRNTTPQLKDTTLKSWFDWFRPGAKGDKGTPGYWKESEMTYFLEFGDIRAEILFRALDKPGDIGRVLSLELTGVWLNEAKLIPVELLGDIFGRIGRYPKNESQDDEGNDIEPWYWSGMIMDTNFPEIDSDWYRVMEGLPIEEDEPESVVDVEVFKQPSGLSPEAENLRYLQKDYYAKKAKGQTEAWIDTYIRAQYTPNESGNPVYRKCYKHERHVSTRSLPIDDDLPVIIGMDAGLTPAAAFKQMTPEGRIHNFGECAVIDTTMGMKQFAERMMKPFIRMHCPRSPLVIIIDPSAENRAQADDEMNCIKILKKAFPEAKVRKATTNDPAVRIGATETALSTWPDGEPLALYDPRCKYLIEGLRTKYKFADKKSRDAGQETKPVKNKWSHVVEAGQYGDMFLLGGKYDAADYVRYNQGHAPVHVPQQTRYGGH